MRREIKEAIAVEKKLSVGICAALALVTLALFWPVLHAEFTNYDDPAYVTQNAMVQTGLNWPGVAWAFHTGHASNWHPLTWISHMLDWQIYGNKAGGHHLTNLLLHIANSILLFLALKKITGALWRSAMVAALFAWHPLHVESVAWIAERKDVLSGFFFMLTIWGYARYVQSANGNELKIKGRKRATFNAQHSFNYLLALIFFALGLMAKPMLVTLPCVLLLLDFWPLKRVTGDGWRVTNRPLLLEKIPFFALALVSSVVTFVVQKQGGSVRSLDTMPMDFRITNALVAYFRYVAKLLWPDSLAVFYPFPNFLSVWPGVAAGVGLVIVTIALLFLARSRAYLATGWLWFAGMLVPVIGFVQVGAASMADRYSYLPSIGIFIAIIWTVAEWAKKIPAQKLFCAAAGGVVLAVCVLRTAFYLPAWHDNLSLFQHALAATGNNYVARINLGSALKSQGKLNEALEQYAAALETRPVFEAFLGMGMIYQDLGKTEDAARNYHAALQLQPDSGLAHNNLGVMLLRLGDLDQAMSELKAALALDAKYPDAHYNLAMVFDAQSKTNDAILHYVAAIQARPDFADAHNNLAVLLARQNEFNAAAGHLAKVLQIRPNDAEAHYNISFAFAMLGRTNEARLHRATALRLKPDLLKNTSSQ